MNEMPDQFLRRVCTGKLQFRSRAKVMKYIKANADNGTHQRMNHDPPPHRVYPYRCPHCLQWHTTKKPLREHT